MIKSFNNAIKTNNDLITNCICVETDEEIIEEIQEKIAELENKNVDLGNNLKLEKEYKKSIKLTGRKCQIHQKL